MSLIFRSNDSEIKKIVSLLRIKPGATVADVGAGKGEFAVALSKLVGPSGKVYAIEADPERVRTIKGKIEHDNLTNLTAIESSNTNSNIPAFSCDAMFARFAYHHFADPKAMNARLFAALKPAARLAIIEFPPKFFLSIFSRVKNVPKNRGGHGIRKEIVIQELEAAGFMLVEKVDRWRRGEYCLMFQKP